MIATKTRTTAIDVKEAFQEIYVEFSELEDKSILLSHFGRFSTELAHSLSERLEKLMLQKRFSTSTIKKMFTIIIEGLKSLCLNGGECLDEHQRGHVMIRNKQNEYYNVSIGNSVCQEKKDEISRNIDRVNELTSAELKEYYNKNLFNTIESDTESAELGLIIMAMKSHSKIEYQFINCHNNCCYLEIRVSLKD